MSAPLDDVKAAVAARLAEPVDGSGLLVDASAQRLAEALAQGQVDQLVHELGNLILPLRDSVERLFLTAMVTPTTDGSQRPLGIYAVRALFAVERLIALYTAACRVADVQAETARRSAITREQSPSVARVGDIIIVDPDFLAAITRHT